MSVDEVYEMDFVLCSADPEVLKIAQAMEVLRHPLEQVIPVGSLVRVTEELDSLTARMMQEYDMTRAEAIGTAKILHEEKSEVVGIHDLTDDSGQQHPYVSIMTPDGFMYAFRSEFIEKE